MTLALHSGTERHGNENLSLQSSCFVTHLPCLIFLTTMNTLKEKIEQIYSRKPEELGKTELNLFEQFKSLLNFGEIRPAEKIIGEWQVNQWVK